MLVLCYVSLLTVQSICALIIVRYEPGQAHRGAHTNGATTFKSSLGIACIESAVSDKLVSGYGKELTQQSAQGHLH